MDLILKLKLLLEQTKFEILYKDKINLFFPQLNGIVDLILITRNNYICIKDFWTFNNLSGDIINNYLIGSSQINSNSDKKFIFILLNKNIDNKINLLNNNILISNNIYYLQQNNQDKLLKDLSYLFYLNNIYYYDYDLDVIMLA